MDFDLSKGINVISGTNGTCKTSLLHMVSNAYQAVTKKCDWLQDAACLDVIKQINSMTNPKISALVSLKYYFELLFKHWVNDPENSDTIRLFYKRLNIMFKKVAEFYGINPQIWTVN